MKAMTWLKAGGCVLIALAAIAAADTRNAEAVGKKPMQGSSHAIASRLDACPVANEQQPDSQSGCCKKEAIGATEHHQSGCCRK
jgi:hypothetical protein